MQRGVINLPFDGLTFTEIGLAIGYICYFTAVHMIHIIVITDINNYKYFW